MSWPPPPGGPHPAPVKLPAWARGNPLECAVSPLEVECSSEAEAGAVHDHLVALLQRSHFSDWAVEYHPNGPVRASWSP